MLAAAMEKGRVGQWLRQQGVSSASSLASLFTDDELDDGTSVLCIATEMGFADQQGLESIESELKHLVDLAKRI